MVSTVIGDARSRVHPPRTPVPGRMLAACAVVLSLAACSPAPVGLPEGTARASHASLSPSPSRLASPAASGPSFGAGAEARWILYQSGGPSGTPLRLVRPDGSDDHLLIPASPPGDDQGHPAWSPDGTTVGFEAWLGLPDPTPTIELWTVGVDGTDLQRLASCDLPCLQLAYPAWSPDGTRVALMSYEVEPDESWGRSAVEILDLASGTREVVTQTADGTSAHYVPHWSPDGDRLVVIVQTYADATQQTVLSSSAAVLDAKPGSTPRTITPDGLFVDHAEWAPGKDIILTAGDSKDSLTSTARVMTIAPDGVGLREIAPRGEPGTIAFDATWIDGGERVMFVSAGPASPERIALLEPRDGTIQPVAWALQTAPGIQRTYAQLQPRP